MYIVEDLNPIYAYLPYVAHEEEIEDPNDPRVKLKKISYLRTFPPYPWKCDGKDHSREDPVRFIEICADAGLVKWEKAEERQARLEREGKREGSYMSFSEYLRDQAMINNMSDYET